MAQRQALLVVNPVAGTRSKRGLSETVIERLAAQGIAVESVMTEGRGHASELAARAVRDGLDMVIAAGGDGTVNEVANTLSNTVVPLGIIPLGSGNGLARSLGIPQDVGEALNIIEQGHVMRCDRGMVNGLPFYCTFGVGFDAAVSEKFAGMKRRGRSTYVRSVLQEFINYKSEPYAISINGSVITERAFLIAVANASQYGNNAYIAPHAKLSDGLLDLIVIHDGSPLSAVKMGVDLLTGFLDRNTRIESFRISAATITRLNAGPAHLDGEPLTLGTHLDVKCNASALTVFSPEKETDFKPILSPLMAMFQDLRYDMLAKLKP
ncbi:MAG: diacylglycerol kinase family lipid kinase [Muribaculaceae bacterium]|nr:diacylglycerol kinase family lipid kinase [Muribaculaceae bacterium]